MCQATPADVVTTAAPVGPVQLLLTQRILDVRERVSGPSFSAVLSFPDAAACARAAPPLLAAHAMEVIEAEVGVSHATCTAATGEVTYAAECVRGRGDAAIAREGGAFPSARSCKPVSIKPPSPPGETRVAPAPDAPKGP